MKELVTKTQSPFLVSIGRGQLIDISMIFHSGKTLINAFLSAALSGQY